MSDLWKEVVKMSPEERAALPYNDPRLDSFTAAVEQRYELPPGLILAVKNAGERSNTLKNGKINASSAGAKGVMQFIDSTREAYQHDPMNPLASIDAAGRYFKDLMQRYDGNVKAAVAEYNGGVRAAKAAQAGEEIPFQETRNYLANIKKFMQKRQSVQADPAGGSADASVARAKAFLKRSKYTIGDIAKKKLLTDEGMAAFMDKVNAEYKSEIKKMSKKERDRFFSHPTFYAREKYPEEMEMLSIMAGPLAGATERQLIAIGLDTPITEIPALLSASGWVYHEHPEIGEPDRVFVSQGADAETLVHEREHLKTQREVESARTIGRIGRYAEPINKFRDDLIRTKAIASDPVLQKVFPATNALNNTRELLANIAGYEASLPEGQSLYDSEFGKALNARYGEESSKEILDQAIALTMSDRGRIVESPNKPSRKRDTSKSLARQALDLFIQPEGE